MNITHIAIDLDEPAKEAWLASFQSIQLSKMHPVVFPPEECDIALTQTFGKVSMFPLLHKRFEESNSSLHCLISEHPVSKLPEFEDLACHKATVKLNHPAAIGAAARAAVYILHSGGIRSTAAVQRALSMGYTKSQICLVHVDFGQPTARKEIRAIEDMSSRPKFANIPFLMVTLDKTLPEVDENPVFVQDMLLAFVVASLFGTTPDAKEIQISRRFHRRNKQLSDFAEMSDFLSSFYGKPMRVTSPQSHLSRQEVLNYSWCPNDETLKHTTTCSDPHLQLCHHCHKCFLLWKDIQESERNFAYFDEDIWTRCELLPQWEEDYQWVRDYMKRQESSHDEADYSRLFTQRKSSTPVPKTPEGEGVDYGRSARIFQTGMKVNPELDKLLSNLRDSGKELNNALLDHAASFVENK